MNARVKFTYVVINRHQRGSKERRTTASDTIQFNHFFGLGQWGYTSRLVKLFLHTSGVTREVNHRRLPTIYYDRPLYVLRRVQINTGSRIYAPIYGILHRDSLQVYSNVTIFCTPIRARRRGVYGLAYHFCLLLSRVNLTNVSRVNLRKTILQSTVNVLYMKGVHSHCAVSDLRQSVAMIAFSLPRANNRCVLQRATPRTRNDNGTKDTFVMNIIVKRTRRPRAHPMGHANTVTQHEGT